MLPTEECNGYPASTHYSLFIYSYLLQMEKT